MCYGSGCPKEDYYGDCTDDTRPRFCETHLFLFCEFCRESFIVSKDEEKIICPKCGAELED